MSRKITPGIIAVIALVWIVLISSFYYIYHKPFTPEFALRMAQFVWHIISAGMVISICGGLGRRIFPGDKEQPVIRAFIQLSVGLGIAATLVFILGFAGYIRITLPVITVAALLLLRKLIFGWWRDLSMVKTVWGDSGCYEKTLVWITGIMLATALIIASAPPIHYDALTYHLALPETYLLNGRISILPEMIRGAMPQLGEMLYLWAATLGGIPAAAVAGWLLGSITILALLFTLRETFKNRAALIGCAALAAGTSIVSALGWGYIDWFCLSFGLAGLICLKRWAQSGNMQDILLAGLAAGFAVASKYTAGVFVVGAILWIAKEGIWQKRAPIKPILLFLTGAILPVLPWLIKNLIATGNPLYPYFSFAGSFSAERAAILQSLPPFGNWLDLVLLPFRATTVGVDGMAGYSHSIGPLLLILGVFAWIKYDSSEQNPLLSIARWVGVTGLIVWAAANQFNGILVQTRMYYVLFPVFAVLAAAGFQALASLSLPRLKLDWLISAFVLLVMILALVQNLSGFIQSNALNYFSGSMTTGEYLSHNLGWYAPAMEKVRTLPESEKTLLLYEPRGFYCLPLCVPDEILDRWSYSLRMQKNDPVLVLEDWRKQGFDYVLVNQSGVDFLMQGSDPHHNPEDLQLLENTLSGLPVVQNFGDSYILYRLK